MLKLSYTKQNFQSGNVLYASQLNAMDDQIKLNADTLENGQIKTDTISLTTTWNGDGPYTQTVTLSNITASSKVDLQPTAAQLSQLISDNVTALTVENNNGTLIVYAIGAAPSIAMTIQCTISEISTITEVGA